MKQIHFFATREDLVPMLELVEGEVSLKYTLMGNFLKSDYLRSGRFAKAFIKSYRSRTELPNLGKATAASAVASQGFLVTPTDEPIEIRFVSKGERFCVDQGANWNTVTFSPGGVWNEDVILSGRVATASDSPIAKKFMKVFHSAIKKNFTKVNVYYIGPKAHELLHQGKRLTNAVQSPREFDLPREGHPAIPRTDAMPTSRQSRRTYEESCKVLQSRGYLDNGIIPPIPKCRPQCDDKEPAGVRFFRAFVGECDLEDLTLPRTYFAKSAVEAVSFKNTNLSESTLCWNDFNGVNFTDANLSQSDLRVSLFSEVAFVRANMRDADLRHSSFEACDFADADMRDSKLTHEQGICVTLSDKQRQEIGWQDSQGDPPLGG